MEDAELMGVVENLDNDTCEVIQKAKHGLLTLVFPKALIAIAIRLEAIAS